MKKVINTLSFVCCLLVSSLVSAHPGHGEAANHSHHSWLIESPINLLVIGAVSVAILVAVRMIKSDKDSK